MWDGIARTAAQIAFLSSARVCGFLLYTRDFRYPHRKKSCGFRSGELAGQGCGVLCEIMRVPKYSWMSLMVSCAVCGWPHLAGTTGWHECPRTFAALPSRTSWKSGGIVPQLPFGCAPVRLQTKRAHSARAANSAPRGALQAVQRSLLNYVRSRIRPEPVVLGVDTPVEFETSLSKGYLPGRQVKFNNLHFLCAIHTHGHDWNWLKHPPYQILFSRASIWDVQQCRQLSHFNTILISI